MLRIQQGIVKDCGVTKESYCLPPKVYEGKLCHYYENIKNFGFLQSSVPNTFYTIKIILTNKATPLK